MPSFFSRKVLSPSPATAFTSDDHWQGVCVGLYDCLWGSKPIITGVYKAVTVGMVAGVGVRVLVRVKVQGYGDGKMGE